jgi:microsomal dipeptidase-like Zn-dependent dipeptidase
VSRVAKIGAAVAGAAAASAGLSAAVALVERRHNRVHRPPPYRASDRALELHRTLDVVDLHADSLLLGRDLVVRSRQGHVDIPRLIEGGIAIETFAAAVKLPRHLNLQRNDDRSDDVTLLALAERWPPKTWRSLLQRALHLADRARRFSERSDGMLLLIDSRQRLASYLERRRSDRGMTAAILAIEGAHALEGDVANVDRVADAGFVMMSPAHFFDTTFGGSAHGVEKGGLTPLGREMVERMEARGMIVDVAHASAATIDDVLRIAKRPVVASHSGVNGTCESIRNLSDDQVRGIAATGGVIGIGFWPAAVCGDDAGAIARAIGHAASVAGVDHVALGSDFDGNVTVPFDATGMPLLVDALLDVGFADAEIGAVMGGNAIRVLTETLPGQ